MDTSFALHPHYVDLEAAGTLKSRQQMIQFRRRQQELNALSYSAEKQMPFSGLSFCCGVLFDLSSHVTV